MTIETVARAIYEATPRNKPYEQLSAIKVQALEAEARAAIAAMQGEPVTASDEMVEEAFRTLVISQYMANGGSDASMTRVWEEFRASDAEQDDINRAIVREVVQSALDMLPLFAHPQLGERSAASEYLVWSNEHRCWWGPEHSGYTSKREHAGRYSREDALKICIGARGGRQYNDNPSEVPVLVEDAMQFWPDDKEEWRKERREWARIQAREEEIF